MFKQYQWKILIRVAALMVVLTAGAFLIAKGYYFYLILVAPVLVYQVLDFFKFHQKAQQEVDQFVESIHYRDFSRYFDVNHAPLEVQSLRQ